MSELTEYKESLRLFKDKPSALYKEQSIPYAHKIRYALVKKLTLLNHSYHDNEIETLIHNIKAAKNRLPKPTDINVTHPAQDKIAKLLAHTHKTYRIYYNEMMMGFDDILKKYHSYHLKGVTFSSFIKRIRKNYSYSGYYERLRKTYAASEFTDCFQTFIVLIDQIALIDTSGILIKNLLKSLKNRGCSPDDMHAFLDDVYDVFTQVQKNYLYNMQKRDEEALNSLKKVYQTDPLELKKYYDFVVHKQGPFCILPYVPHHTIENNLAKKLQYDVNQMSKEHHDQEERFQEQLKDLKKKIHHFSYSVGFPSRIKKIVSAENKLASSMSEEEQVQLTPSPVREELENTSSIAESSENSKEQESSIEEETKKNYIKEEEVKKESIDRQEYEKFYYLEKNEENYTYFVNAEKQEKRQLQMRNKKIANRAAFLNTIAEGIIGANAIVTTYLFFPPVTVFIVAWFMGGFINNLLYKMDNFDVLNAFTLKKKVKNEKNHIVYEPLIFIDEHGKPLSLRKKIGLLSVFALSLSTGIVYGALSFMNSQSVFINLLVNASNLLTGFFANHLTICLTVFGCIGAACPAVAMFIGITCIFFKVIADFVRNNRYQKICNYLHEHFIAPWQAMGSWKYDWQARISHLAKCTGRILLLGITIAATLVFTVASMGIFYQQTLNFLSYVSKPTQIISKVSTFLNAIISLPFQIDGANKVLQPVCRRHTFSDLMQKTVKISLSPIQKEESRVRKLGASMVLVTAAGNGACIGELNTLSNASSLQPVKMGMIARKINPATLKYTSFVGCTFSSTLPNGNAGLGVFKRKEPRMNIKGDSEEEKRVSHLKSFINA